MSLNLSDIAKKVKAATVIRWGESEWESMNNLIQHESGYQSQVANKNSGACGIFQAYPCSKLLAVCPDMSEDCQIAWGLNYIENRYQSPSKAWKHWLAKVPVDGKDVGNWY